ATESGYTGPTGRLPSPRCQSLTSAPARLDGVNTYRDLGLHPNLATLLALFGEDRLDAVWLARLTRMGLLRASFGPPEGVRGLRDYTGMRTRPIQERTRCFQRLEKLLESALVKVSSVASKLTTVSAQDMIRAMAAGQRDPRVLASLARSRMKAKRDELAEA